MAEVYQIDSASIQTATIGGSLVASSGALIDLSLASTTGVTSSVFGTSSWAVNATNVIFNTTNSQQIWYQTFVATTTGSSPEFTTSSLTVIPGAGSMTATSFTGSLLGTSSWASQAVSASFAPGSAPATYTSSLFGTSSWAQNATNVQFNTTNSQQTWFTTFVATTTGTTPEYTTSSLTVIPGAGSMTATSFTGSLQGTASWTVTASFAQTANATIPSAITASVFGTASNAVSASFAQTSITSSNVNWPNNASTYLGFQAAGNNSQIDAQGVAIGYQSMISASQFSARYVSVGYQAGPKGGNSTQPNDSVFIGYNAGQYTQQNTDIGMIVIGREAASGSTFVSSTVFIGFQAGASASNCISSVIIGHQAGGGGVATSTANNLLNQAVIIGYQAGYQAVTASSGVFVGYQAGYHSAGNNNTFIGIMADAASPSVAVSNSIAIGNNAKVSSSNTCVIGGVGAASAVKVGIGTANITNSLDVVGNISCSVITASSLFGTSSWATNAINAATQQIQWSLPNSPISYSNNQIVPSSIGFMCPVQIGTSIMFYGGSVLNSITNSIYSCSIYDPLTIVDCGKVLPVAGVIYNPGNIQVIGNKIYFFGGEVIPAATRAQTGSNLILTASISSPHIVGTAANTLPAGVGGHNLFQVGNTLYAVFGSTGSSVVSSLFSGSMSASISQPLSWSLGPDVTLTTSSMRCMRGQHIQIGNTIYVYGGWQPLQGDSSNHRVLTASIGSPTTWGIGAEGIPAWIDSPHLANIGQMHYWLGGGSGTGSTGNIVAFSASAPFTPISIRTRAYQDVGGALLNQGMATVVFPPIAFSGSLTTPIYQYGALDDGGNGTLNQIYKFAVYPTIAPTAVPLFDYSLNRGIQTALSIPYINELVTLASNAVQANQLQANLEDTTPPWQQGLLFWDTGSNSWTYYNENAQVSVNLGLESLISVGNLSGGTINNGVPVYISGSSNGFPLIFPAIADGTSSKSNVAGITTCLLNQNGTGYITTTGLVHGMSLNFPAGSDLYLSAATSGTFTTTKPTGSADVVKLGVYTVSGSGTGVLLVTLTNKAFTAFTASFVATSSLATTASFATTTSFAAVASTAVTASFASNFSTNNLFSRGGTILNSSGIPNAVQNIIVWRAGFPCTASQVSGLFESGSSGAGADINAQRNFTSSLLTSSLHLTASNQWRTATALQTASFSTGDTLSIVLTATSGSVTFPTMVAIQVDFTR